MVTSLGCTILESVSTLALSSWTARKLDPWRQGRRFLSDPLKDRRFAKSMADTLSAPWCPDPEIAMHLSLGPLLEALSPGPRVAPAILAKAETESRPVSAQCRSWLQSEAQNVLMMVSPKIPSCIGSWSTTQAFVMKRDCSLSRARHTCSSGCMEGWIAMPTLQPTRFSARLIAKLARAEEPGRARVKTIAARAARPVSRKLSVWR